LSSNCKPYRIFIPLLLISVDFIVKGWILISVSKFIPLHITTL
jgi:hypothetical protein